MRVIIFIALLAVAGCASEQRLAGKHAKHGSSGSVMRYERLGTATGTGLPADMMCGKRQVQWCTSGTHGRSCRCLHTHEAGDRVRRMADQLSRMQNAH